MTSLFQTIRLLIVEDDDAFDQLLQQMLARSVSSEYAIRRTRTLDEALEAATGEAFDLALLDLNLPDSSGFETFARFHARAEGLPVIVLSGVADESLASETVLHGAQDYLIKGPMNHLWLNRSIRYALERIAAHRNLLKAHVELEERIAERTAELSEANRHLQREIADRRQAESALRESNRELALTLERLRRTRELAEQREQLQALGRIASGIAHDFNNCLAPIVGFSQILLSDPAALADAAKARRYLKMIHDAAAQGSQVVGRLREFYQMRDAESAPRTLGLNDLLEQVVAITQPHWNEQARARGTSISIRKNLDPAGPEIRGVEAELQEVFTAILLDATRSISGQGEIAITTSRGPDESSVHIRFPKTATGTAPAPQANDLISGIIERHGASIATDRKGEHGVTVIISFPRERGLLPDKPAMNEPDSKPLRILVVEDDSMVREVITVFLTEDRHTVEVAENGREGLEKFSAQPFDVLLTDRSMPGMNGDQLAYEAKRVNPEVPVILLTGYGDLMQGTNEKPEGVDLILGKPFTIESLRGAIRQALGD